MRNCKLDAEYVVLFTKKRRKEHAFSCWRHLGETVRGVIDCSTKCRATVAYKPSPGTAGCG